ncbi:MAG: type 4a pilus biogenesis protein PilO [Pseudomonadales bacterium]|nr:type 4a pilus biogenesis protein PilO [Pseudomonadales bacterium]
MLGLLSELKSFDWNDLGDIETIGVWPGPVKIVLVLAIFSVFLAGGYWFHIKNLQQDLATVTAQETTLRNDFETKAVLAANLEAYEQQMLDMEESFGTLLRQLPGKTEVPGLLEDITFTGQGSGLEFSTIQLQDERVQEFYVELPITITVSGAYHDFGTFVSGVASLPRIVTLHDFTITAGTNRTVLDMTITARTYRYNSDNE